MGCSQRVAQISVLPGSKLVEQCFSLGYFLGLQGGGGVYCWFAVEAGP